MTSTTAPDAVEPGGARALRTDLVSAALFALAYFAGSELGYALSLGPSVGATFWPPAGISLGVFLASPMRAWPLLVAGGALANYGSDLLHGQVLAASVSFALANLGEPVLGAFILRRILPPPVGFTRLQELVALAFVVVLISAPLGAAIGAGVAELYTQNPPGFAAGWRTWWVGDFVGALVMAPFTLRLITGWRQTVRLPGRIWIEAAAFVVVLWAVTEIVFTAAPASLAMPFLVFPVLLWASVRLGVIAVGAALCLVVVLTTHDTVAGMGPFAAEHLSFGDRLIALQIYVAVMALSFYAIALLWEERARTAAALRLAHSGLEARYRRIVEQSPLSILALDAGGRVLDANPAWRRLITPAEVAGTPHGPDQPWRNPQIEPLLNRAFAGEVVELPERELRVPGQPETLVRVRGFAYPVKDERGGVAEIVLIEQDITDAVLARQQLVDANRALQERQRALSHALREMAATEAHREHVLEAERFARGEAERASQLKDEFLATLSHELRTPLNAIVGWAHILRRTSNDPALTPAIDTIARNARAQAKLIEDLLDMSRILAGKIGLTLTRTRLADVVARAAEALQPAADAKGVRLSVAIDDREEAWVLSDAARLQQVVTNLLDNGIKFTAAGGFVEARVLANGPEAQVIVRDSGQGIAAEFLPAVFDRFRQADGSTTRLHGGLGIGLSIAKQVVELHGGSICVHSDGTGLGATFTVTLPVAATATGAAGSSPVPDPVSLTDLRVLVVDDDGDARELLRRVLAEQGCDVVCAASAEEALRRLDAGPFDVLLSDIGMPGTDGYGLLERVRASPHKAIKAVAVTAFARPQDRERALTAGFDEHVAKPTDPAQLLQALAAVTAEGARPRRIVGIEPLQS